MKSLEEQLKNRERELECIGEMIELNKDDDKILFDLYKRESELSLEIQDIKRWIETENTL